MPLDPARVSPLMCLTQDGTGVAHSVQAERLCAAGARWVQLRMKDAAHGAWLDEARLAVRACHAHGAVLIVNDSIEVALASGADGVHLGRTDTAWAQARKRMGRGAILGGTVNNPADAGRALSEGCLDYAGVGPLRFTPTKKTLSPVIGIEGVRSLVAALAGLPAWVIGGVRPDDMALLRSAGAAGAAVSSHLHRAGRPEVALREFLAAWDAAAPVREAPVLS